MTQTEPQTAPAAPAAAAPAPAQPLESVTLLQFAGPAGMVRAPFGADDRMGPPAPRPEPFDVVIVGSGYGGSMALHQLAQTPEARKRQLRVLLLERGKAFHPGEFPGRFAELPRELRMASQTAGTVNGHEGLFDLRHGDDVAVLVANGLGGGSLINAGVMLEPAPDDVRENDGRTALAAHLRQLLERKTFTRARRMLGGEVLRGGRWVHNSVSRLPTPPRKTRAFAAIAADRDSAIDTLDITVGLDGGPNYAKVDLAACNHCGDCMTGCNVGAKDSLDRNLLLKAQRELGSQLTIVTGATVTSLRRTTDDEAKAGVERTWWLRVVHTDAQLQDREAGTLRLAARHVVLAAGTLGSPEILLRSRDDTLLFSSALGESFSGNGDDIAAIHRLPQPVHGSADEDVDLPLRQVGPTTTARVVLKSGKPSMRPFLLEEFTVPGPMRRLFDETVTTAHALARIPRGDCERHGPDDLDPLAVDSDAMAKTLLVGVIGHDDARGSLRLAVPNRPRGGVPQMGTVRIHWQQARWSREMDASHERLRGYAEQPLYPPLAKARPELVSNPMWRLLPPGLETLVGQPRGPVLTVHPLGGCRIGRHVGDGVVDSAGIVFRADGSNPADDWQGTLAVLDGSIIGSSLGVNPALTIATLALSAMDTLCARWKYGTPACDPDLDPALPTDAPADHPAPAMPEPPPAWPAAPPKTSLSITERLWGPVDLLGSEPLIAEFTLDYAPQSVATLIGPKRLPMPVQSDRSRLRLYSAAAWHEHHLEAADDEDRAAFVRFEARLGGSLRFLHREATHAFPRSVRAFSAWFVNRGIRDIYQRLSPRFNAARRRHKRALDDARRGDEPAKGLWQKLREGAWEFAHLASHNGQVRRFDYRLEIGAVLHDPGGALGRQLRPAQWIHGAKRLTYGRRANPWTQLTELQLTAMPGLVGTPAPLKLDMRYLARQGQPLVAIHSQRNHAEALAELTSLGLYLVRVLVGTHLWSMRRPDSANPPLPDPQRERAPDRLPRALPEVPPPKRQWLVTDRWPKDSPHAGEPLSILLTRYAQPPHKPAGKPLVMVHGYSASGTTFAHPSLQPSAAQHFWKLGRDVWVVDLRTSCGLDSAAYPWAMEQAGAIDLPAALLHVRNETGRKVDVLAHCIGGAMLAMALLTDEKLVKSGLQELGVDSWLTSEHLGVLSAFNGTAPAGGAHPTIDRIVLSQKGPVMRYTDENVLRAFLMQYVRRFLLPDGWRFQRSRDPGAAEEVIDRLLSSLPYPAADFDVENPRWPCATTPWTATRHRLDALFGRTFSAANLRPETLGAIDDFFGPINLDTVAQAIHFARTDRITNQRGRGEFVTRGRVRARWSGIPTLVLHAADNGMVDPYTLQLAAQTLGDAGVPLTVLPALEGTGHQDTLIGRGAATAFTAIERFLCGEMAPNTVATAAQPQVASAPWIGPRLVMPQPVGALGTGIGPPAPARVAAMVSPMQGDATLWLVPVHRYPDPGGTGASFVALPPGEAEWAEGERGDSAFWLFCTPPANVPAAPAGSGAEAGWLALVVYDIDESTAVPVRSPLPPSGRGPTPPPRGAAAPQPPGPVAANAITPPTHRQPRDRFQLNGLLDRPALNVRAAAAAAAAAAAWSPLAGAGDDKLAASRDKRAERAGIELAVRQWMADPPAADAEFAFVSLADVQRCRALPGQPGLRFALGSCQYPHGLFDRTLAGASLDKLAGTPDIGLALMVGDQIYADATAGLTDPTRRDEKYDLPHQRAFRLDAMRRVMRRMPTAMLLDDHELFDNWQPLPADLDPLNKNTRVEDEKERIADARREGVDAWLRYQRMRRRERTDVDAAQDHAFMAGGHAFYLLDTRTRRQRGRPSDGAAGVLIDDRRLAALKTWLSTNAGLVKFIVSPSMLLPRRRELARDERNAPRGDSWAAFPDTMEAVLAHIAAQSITQTVFLSGDEHHSLHAAAYVGAARIKVLSVHASGLYAPYPFANGLPRELQTVDSQPVGELPLHVDATLPQDGPLNGFTSLRVVDDNGIQALEIIDIKPVGGAPVAVRLPLI